MSSASCFESLGDNCEFGFVQRRNGIEPGGLLRWSISRPRPLIENIENGFEGIYEFGNLLPYSRKMVRDGKTGLMFHSQMESEDGRFLQDETVRRGIHGAEHEKVLYLREKLLAELASPSKHFVYKHNPGISRGDCEDLARAVRDKGQGLLLVVHAGVPDRMPGSVEHLGENLYFGHLREFAKYQSANLFDLDVWMDILRNALAMMPPPRFAQP